jgi:hypothetical protein
MESTIKNRSNRSYKYETIKATGVTEAVSTVISADFWRQLLTKQVNDIAFYDVLRDFERDERNKIILGDIELKVTTIQRIELSEIPKDINQQLITIYFEVIINDYTFKYNYSYETTLEVQILSPGDMLHLLQKVLIAGVLFKHNLQLIQSTLIAEAF